MKKIIIFLSMVLILTGCGNREENIVKKFTKKIENSGSYKISGNMEIVSNEDTFKYKIEASKSKDGYYKVNLVNKTNDHEQIILKNKEGVYVVTPELNKSFKFQSEWPNNGSQSYLLDILVNDVKNDEKIHVENTDKIYIQCRVNYPNNSTLYSEKIYLNNNYDVEKVEVLDQDGNVKITLSVSKIDYNTKFSKDYFELSTLISENNTKDEEVKEDESNTGYILKDIIYPLYVPTNTELNSEDTINTSDGNRAILTFSGDSPFILIEEVSRTFDELEVIPVNGDPLIMSDSIGAISNNSLYWTSNGIDYYLSSNSMDSSELMTIAEGLTGTSIIVSSEK